MNKDEEQKVAHYFYGTFFEPLLKYEYWCSVCDQWLSNLDKHGRLPVHMVTKWEVCTGHGLIAWEKRRI